MAKKLTKKQEEYRVILDNYMRNECIKIDLDYINQPVVCKLFSNKFDYSKIFKAGIPSYELLSEQLGNPEVKLTSIMIPSYFYKYFLDGDLEVYRLEVFPADNTVSCEFLELVVGGETLLTIYSEDSNINIDKSFKELKEALNHKGEISEILNPKE
jgi:hypothetical protein